MSASDNTTPFRTIYSEGFNCEKFIYHYTSFETALRIIHSDKLLFSQLNNTNDPSEKKIKISFMPNGIKNKKEYDDIRNSIVEYFDTYHKLFQAICFCQDIKLKNDELQKAISRMNPKDRFYDFSGRGFALPRMWAQYGENSKGVCLIFNKKTILSSVDKDISIKKYKQVEYYPFYHRFELDKNKMNDIYRRISQSTNGVYTLINLLEVDSDFINYNFFEKNSDWENEREFRIIAMTDYYAKEKRVAINNIHDALEGIVIGENAEEINIISLKAILKKHAKKCKIRRLIFSDRLYRIKEE